MRVQHAMKAGDFSRSGSSSSNPKNWQWRVLMTIKAANITSLHWQNAWMNNQILSKHHEQTVENTAIEAKHWHSSCSETDAVCWFLTALTGGTEVESRQWLASMFSMRSCRAKYVVPATGRSTRSRYDWRCSDAAANFNTKLQMPRHTHDNDSRLST